MRASPATALPYAGPCRPPPRTRHPLCARRERPARSASAPRSLALEHRCSPPPSGSFREDRRWTTFPPGAGTGRPDTFPGTASTATGSIVAPAGGSGPGVAVVDRDARRPDALGGDAPSGKRTGRAMVPMGFSQAVDNSEGGLINTFFPLIGAAFCVGEGMLGLLSAISKFARKLFGPF